MQCSFINVNLILVKIFIKSARKIYIISLKEHNTGLYVGYSSYFTTKKGPLSLLLSNAFAIKQLQHVLDQNVSEVADSLLGGFVAPCLVDIKEARSHPQNLTLDNQFFRCIYIRGFR